MLNLPNYARVLRCVGQALQHLQIEAFELKSYFCDFRLLAGDPNPPYTGLIEVALSAQEIEVLEREGQGRRGQSNLNLSLTASLRCFGPLENTLIIDMDAYDGSTPAPRTLVIR